MAGSVTPAVTSAACYLTAPPVRPRTMALCEKRIRITIGITIVTPTALINSQGLPQGEKAWYTSVTDTLSVLEAGDTENDSGYSRLFQALMKLIRPIVTRPGMVTGRRMCQKIWGSEAPSMMAASSI